MNILPKACLFIFLIVNAIHSGSAVFKSKYGIKTIEYPKESCQRIDNVRSKGQCLGACVISVDKIVMISHDESTKTCMCCNDISGSDIIGPNWKSYALRTFPLSGGCTTYNLTSHQICLKYFPVTARYSSARNLCQAEGGDLIKIESQEKYDIFETFHVPIANNTLIEVWVQGEKIEGQWKFDDGTPIPNFCPISSGTNPEEIRIRARGSTSFVCWDNLNIALFHYTCEYLVN